MKSRTTIPLKERKAAARKRYNERLKARFNSDPEFADQIRRKRWEAGRKWLEKLKLADPEKHAATIAKYKARNAAQKKQLWHGDMEFRQRQYEYLQKRRRTNPEVRLAQYVRNRVNALLRGKVKSARALDMVGCSMSDLRQHLEAQFSDGMTWRNHGIGSGRWNIDHVRPLASFDLADPEEQKLAFHFSNLKPEWSDANQEKSSNWNGRLWRHSDHACQPAQSVQAPPP